MATLSRNQGTLTPQPKGTANTTWDEATFTWDQGAGTWGDPFGLVTQARNQGTLTPQTKN